jgi:alkylated DNA repair dioxygenase AlkB
MMLRPKAKCSVGAESRNAKGTKVDILKMVLRHGDLVVMHGTGIQKLYEVCYFLNLCLQCC